MLLWCSSVVVWWSGSMVVWWCDGVVMWWFCGVVVLCCDGVVECERCILLKSFGNFSTFNIEYSSYKNNYF